MLCRTVLKFISDGFSISHGVFMTAGQYLLFRDAFSLSTSKRSLKLSFFVLGNFSQTHSSSSFPRFSKVEKLANLKCSVMCEKRFQCKRFSHRPGIPLRWLIQLTRLYLFTFHSWCEKISQLNYTTARAPHKSRFKRCGQHFLTTIAKILKLFARHDS